MKDKSLILTANFSIVFPGLGHLYNGKIILSIIILFLINVLYLLFYYLLNYFEFKIIFILLLILLLLNTFVYLFNIIHSIYLTKKQKNYNKKFYNRWYYYIAYMIICILLFIIQPKLNNKISSYIYNSEAMKPTVLLNEYLLGIKGKNIKIHYDRGDLALYITKDKFKIESLTRIVGVPGDSINIKFNKLYINDQIIQENIDEAINNYQMDYLKKIRNEKYFVISENYYFIMGDNRSNSFDSRFYGPIEKEYIIGKPLIIYYSKDKSRIFKILYN